MFTVVTRRLLILVPTLFGVIALTFFAARAGAPSPGIVKFGEHGSKEAIVAWEKEHGFDRPLSEQFTRYLQSLCRGKLGQSLVNDQSVWDALRERFPATVELTLAALLVSLALGVGVGVLAAAKPHSWFDYSSMSAALAGVSIPVFWLGLLAIMAFGATLPYRGRVDEILLIETGFESKTHFILFESALGGKWDIFRDALMHLILPALVLATVPVATIARMTRTAMIETQQEDYIRTAKAKGLRRFFILFKHSLKNAMPTISTAVGLETGYMLSGAILTERIFSWPGIGSYLVESSEFRDYPAIQGVVILIAVVFISVNLLVDLSYLLFDPRVRVA